MFIDIQLSFSSIRELNLDLEDELKHNRKIPLR